MAEGGLEKVGTGYAVIIVNVGKDSPKSFQSRQGADTDGLIIRGVFVDVFGCKKLAHEVDVSVDRFDHTKGSEAAKARSHSIKSTDERRKCCIRCLLKTYDFSEATCMILSISTHGSYDKHRGHLLKFIGEEINQLSVEDIYDVLSDENVPSLKGIPKIVFIQACRGQMIDRGIDVADKTKGEGYRHPLASDPSNINVEAVSEEEEDEEEDESNDEMPAFLSASVPEDFVVVFSTVPGHKAHRVSGGPSYMEKNLREVVEELDSNKEIDFLKLITLVNDKLSAETMHVRDEKSQQDDASLGENKLVKTKNVLCMVHRLTQSIIFQKMERKESEQPAPNL